MKRTMLPSALLGSMIMLVAACSDRPTPFIRLGRAASLRPAAPYSEVCTLPTTGGPTFKTVKNPSGDRGRPRACCSVARGHVRLETAIATPAPTGKEDGGAFLNSGFGSLIVKVAPCT
jgi:hypothetical protein